MRPWRWQRRDVSEEPGKWAIGIVERGRQEVGNNGTEWVNIGMIYTLGSGSVSRPGRQGCPSFWKALEPDIRYAAPAPVSLLLQNRRLVSVPSVPRLVPLCLCLCPGDRAK